MPSLIQNLFPGPTLPQSAAPLIPYTSRTMDSRSIAIEMPAEISDRETRPAFVQPHPIFLLRSLWLKTRKLYSRLGPSVRELRAVRPARVTVNCSFRR